VALASAAGGALRGQKALPYFAEKGARPEPMPAMLARVVGPDGSGLSLHRTYLKDGKRFDRKMMTGVDSIVGGAVRIRDPKDAGIYIVGEGIETTLAGYQWFLNETEGLWTKPVAVWAATSAHMLKELQLRQDANRVLICADNDYSLTGQEAALSLGRRLKTRPKRECFVSILMPAQSGQDVLDALNSSCQLLVLGEQAWR